MRQVVIYRGEDQMWVAECPSLPGCISQGATREVALTNIKEAIDLYVETYDSDKRYASASIIYVSAAPERQLSLCAPPLHSD